MKAFSALHATIPARSIASRSLKSPARGNPRAEPGLSLLSPQLTVELALIDHRHRPILRVSAVAGVAQLEGAVAVESHGAIDHLLLFGPVLGPAQGEGPRVAHHAEPDAVCGEHAAQGGFVRLARREAQEVLVDRQRLEHADEESREQIASDRADRR